MEAKCPSTSKSFCLEKAQDGKGVCVCVCVLGVYLDQVQGEMFFFHEGNFAILLFGHQRMQLLSK